MKQITCMDYGPQCRFDSYCKTVLRNENWAHSRNQNAQRKRQISLDDLSSAELSHLYTVDHYPCESTVFSTHGYQLHIESDSVAEAFSALPELEQSILILRFAQEMTDTEIGELMGMSRSAIQRHRTKALQQLREALEGG